MKIWNWLIWLLIEPLWNWNKIVTKQKMKQCRLLIEPLWNWNPADLSGLANAPILLIEPLWNWNIDPSVFLNVSIAAFNRTTVELKRMYRNSYRLHSLFLLIEPLWNWNEFEGERPSGMANPFNRTTVELKQGKINLNSGYLSSF